MTCHNRKETTRRCLANLVGQTGAEKLEIFLVDDGSTDGTAAMVSACFPTVNVISGTGSLYWNGGMRRAWHAAIESKIQFTGYLWLNDDVTLFKTAIQDLVAGIEAVRGTYDKPPLLVGATIDSESTAVTYGGHVIENSNRPFRLRLAATNGTLQRVDNCSGNFVYVPSSAYESLGSLRADFIHIFGDLDYGRRAADAQIPILLLPRVVGCCDSNSLADTSLDRSRGKLKRLLIRFREESKIHSIDWRTFVWLHEKKLLRRIGYIVSPYLKILSD